MSIIDNAKEVVEIIRKLDNMELYQKILDLQGQIIDLTNENRSLEEEIKNLKEKLSISKKMTFKKPFCYLEGDPVPFCPRCWEVSKLAVHLTGPEDWDDRHKYKCPGCGNQFFDEKRPTLIR